MKVFISYSSKNRLRALRLVQALDNYGIKVWWDEWEVLVGHPIIDSIYDGIRSCDYLAVILTKQSIKSKWVSEELNFAKQEEFANDKVKILPLLYEKCDLPPLLINKHYADFTNFDKGFSELIKLFQCNPKKEIKNVPSLSDAEIIQHFNNIENGSLKESLESAFILSKFRDPKAKKLLLRKLHGDAYERQVAIIGLQNYGTEDVLFNILHAIPVDYLICNLYDEEVVNLCLKTVKIFFDSLVNYSSDLARLYIWGGFLSKYAYSFSPSTKIYDIVYKKSVQCIKKITFESFVLDLIRLFGYQNVIDKLMNIQSQCDKQDTKLINELLSHIPKKRKSELKFPIGVMAYCKFLYSKIVGEKVIYLELPEYASLGSAFRRNYLESEKAVNEELKIWNSLLMAFKEVYGYLPEQDNKEDQALILNKLDLFFERFNYDTLNLTEDEFKNILKIKNPSEQDFNKVTFEAFEYSRLTILRAAMEFMFEKDMYGHDSIFKNKLLFSIPAEELNNLMK